jgi:hypothetical protein
MADTVACLRRSPAPWKKQRPPTRRAGSDNGKGRMASTDALALTRPRTHPLSRPPLGGDETEEGMKAAHSERRSIRFDYFE